LLRLRERLGERPRSVVELARAEDVGRRTIERDLHTLEFELGEEVLVDKDHRYRLPERGAPLSHIEALALYAGAETLNHTEIGEWGYRSAMKKLAGQLPEAALGAELKRVPNPCPAPGEEVLDLVARAWFQHRRLRCHCPTIDGEPGQPLELDVYYVEIGRRHHEAFMLAFDHSEQARVRGFAVARIREVELLDATFEMPPGFAPEIVLAGAFGIDMRGPTRLRVRVSAEVAARFLEASDGAIEASERHADGSVTARVRGVPGVPGRARDLILWLLGWGDGVEVLPAESVRALSDT
jgi:predicted DNA-binding transcriptional regulator YafY